MSTILIFVATALTVWFIVLYNRLIRDKNRVFAAWSDIEVQLKRRHDLIPKLVQAVNAYIRYERTTLEAMTGLRGETATPEAHAETARLENRLSGEVRNLLAVAESYPELKADKEFLTLLQNLTAVENDIQSARRYYNGTVRNLNIRIDSFPDMIPARLFRFRAADFFELESASEKQPPELNP